jgi:uncharacterized Zn finger protein (UPF0148 family)
MGHVRRSTVCSECGARYSAKGDVLCPACHPPVPKRRSGERTPDELMHRLIDNKENDR